jgi:cytochrome c553
MLTALFFGTAAAQDAALLQACAACHGADGNSRLAGAPSLAGQPRIYLENQLVLFRDGTREFPAMNELLKGRPDRELVALAKHYTALKPKPVADKAPDKALSQRGRVAAQKLGCASCHEKDYRGREQMPRLAAQREDYLYDTMLQYQKKPRRGGDTMMNEVLRGVPEAEVRAMAHYMSHFK